MRRTIPILMLAAALSLAGTARSEPGPDVAKIRAEMARIRRSTNWEDPKAAADANKQISDLAQQLMRGAQPDQFEAGGKAKAGSQADLINQTAKTVGKGEKNADLAASIRAEVDEYETRKPDYTPRSTEIFADLETLVIDLSQPQGQAIAKRLDSFRRVKHLVVTGGEKGAAIDLAQLLRKASALPLEELHVVHFRSFLTQVPDSMGSFKQLRTLSLVDNGIRKLPPSIGKLDGLSVLYVDANPIDTVLPTVKTLRRLTALGVARTGVGAAEVESIRRVLPDCKVEAR